MTREGANSNVDSNPISHNQTEANSSCPIEGDFPDVAGDNSLSPVKKKKKKKKKKKQETDSQPPISATSSGTGTVTENKFVADTEILSGTSTPKDGSSKIVKEPISCLEKAAELTTAGSDAFPPLMQDENLSTAEATTMKGSDFEVTKDSSRGGKNKAGSKDKDKQDEKPNYADPLLVKEM